LRGSSQGEQQKKRENGGNTKGKLQNVHTCSFAPG
jgi:hypothetical protein